MIGKVACFVGDIFRDGDTFVGDAFVGDTFVGDTFVGDTLVGDVWSPDAASAPFPESSLSKLIIDAIFSSTAFMPGV